MRQNEAKSEILNLWRENKEPWERGNHIKFYQSAQNFYYFLEEKYPALLSFRCTGDKWQVVKSWINEFERYPNC